MGFTFSGHKQSVLKTDPWNSDAAHRRPGVKNFRLQSSDYIHVRVLSPCLATKALRD